MQISIELVGNNFFKQKVLHEILETLNENKRIGYSIEAQVGVFFTTSKRMYKSEMKEITNKDVE